MTSGLVFALLAVTAGWENVSPTHAEFAPAKVLWRADFACPAAFELEKVGGAEGEAAFTNGTLILKKTNASGMLVLRSSPYACGAGARLRLAADVQVVAGDVERVHLCIRARDKDGAWKPCHELYPARGAAELYSGGPELMLGAVNSAPGRFYRKYGHFLADVSSTAFAIIATGTPSTSVWRDWTAEDVDAAQEKWKQTFADRTPKDRAAERIPTETFDRQVAADTDHVAAIRSQDDVTRLFVDGQAVPPAAFRAKGSFGADALDETFSGASVAKAGVRILAKPINMGTGARGRRYWSREGFDAKGAVADLKRSMRIAPDALYMVALDCNPYPEFTAEEYPAEAFVTQDGRKLMGNGGTTAAVCDDMGLKDDGKRWPWVSFASRKWRDAVKANIRALVAELKRTGLSKRVVGIHLCGFGDGQFYVGPPDYSPVAKAGYAKWCDEPDHVSTNYAFYAKCLAMSAQEKFAETFKTAMGKDTVAVIWLMAQFITTHYLGEFQRGKWVDVAVIQQSYSQRHPGVSVEPRMPYTSFERHGKMYWCELDLRTYGALDTWAVSAPATKGLGQADDFAAWQTTYRKHLGPVIAQRQGFWFYDMAAGWFDPPEIRADIAETLRVQERLLARKPSPWRPSVAVVFDEAGLIGWDGGTVPLNNYTHYLFPVQMERLAMSGVPFEFFLAEDVMRDPSLLAGSKTVVLADFRKFDSRRIDFVRRLADCRRTLVFVGEPGVLGGGESAMGLTVGYSRSDDEPHAVLPGPGVAADLSSRVMLDAERNLADGIWPVKVPCGPRAWIEGGQGMKVLSRFGDGRVAAAERAEGAARFVCVAEPAGLSPSFFNQLCHESGAYVPVSDGGLQVNMNGDFLSVHALRNGRFAFRLPFACRVRNLKSGREETVTGDVLPLVMTAGETCWFELDMD